MYARGLVVLLCLISCTRPPEVPDASVPSPPAVAAPPPLDLDARYGKKPMLAVIEGYALAVIGQLPAGQEAILAPKVQHAFGGDTDWRATVRTTMQWPANIDERIQFEWKKFSEKATQAGAEPDAKAFARAFGDQYAK